MNERIAVWMHQMRHRRLGERHVTGSVAKPAGHATKSTGRDHLNGVASAGGRDHAVPWVRSPASLDMAEDHQSNLGRLGREVSSLDDSFGLFASELFQLVT